MACSLSWNNSAARPLHVPVSDRHAAIKPSSAWNEPRTNGTSNAMHSCALPAHTHCVVVPDVALNAELEPIMIPLHTVVDYESN